MKASRKLKPVAQFAQQRERNAAREMGNTMTKAQQHKKQLDDLFAYRKQYMHSFQTIASAGTSVVRVRNYQLFLKRIDEAINLQQQQLANSHKDCENSRTNWQGAYGHSKMIDQVVEARKNAEKKKIENSEQRESDEHSQCLSSLTVI